MKQYAHNLEKLLTNEVRDYPLQISDKIQRESRCPENGRLAAAGTHGATAEAGVSAACGKGKMAGKLQ